jgi:uncharacterized membrane protein YjjP (DUF1212 family)
MFGFVSEFLKKENAKKLATMLIVSVLSMIFIVYNFVEFSTFLITFVKAIAGIMIFWWVDEYLLKGVDTIQEILKGNIAYALFLFSIAAIIVGAIVAG